MGSTRLGLTHTLRILGALGVLAVREIKLFSNFCLSPKDKKIHRKIITLINDIVRQPFTGLGKPEPLKHELSGYWSRRITDEHRLVYEVTETEIIILSCRFHYDD